IVGAPGILKISVSEDKLPITSGYCHRRGTNDAEDEKRELEFKKEGQEYGQVLRMLGNGRCEVLCSDETTRLSHICGKLHKKVWISAGDIVLVCVRDYQDTKADVVHRYYHHEARSLKAYGELPECIRPGGLDDGDDDGDDCVEFAEGEDFVDNI
ncbi:eukaryotic translation initiation factor 1A, partial [Tanacetum coccineum]